jgi:Predicted ATP-dependent serine protease
MSEVKIPRALTLANLKKTQHEVYPFEGAWFEAFGRPARRGVWFFCGGSTNGKSSFAAQMGAELARLGDKVLYVPLEEGNSLSVQNAFREVDPLIVGRRLLISPGETMEQLDARLSRRQSPDAVIIDSFQYAQLTYRDYIMFKEKHRNKTIIFSSHADGKQPAGRAARSVKFDASLKIWIEGFVAHSQGRYIGPNGGKFVIWEEGARRYWGDEAINQIITMNKAS